MPLRGEFCTVRVVPGPGSLDERLRAVRKRRMASRLSTATAVAAWIAVLSALLVVVGSGLLISH